MDKDDNYEIKAKLRKDQINKEHNISVTNLDGFTYFMIDMSLLFLLCQIPVYD